MINDFNLKDFSPIEASENLSVYPRQKDILDLSRKLDSINESSEKDISNRKDIQKESEGLEEKGKFTDTEKDIYERAGVDIDNPTKETLAGEKIDVYPTDIDHNLIGPDGLTNKERMEMGKSPYKLVNGKLVKVELHHHRQNSSGPYIELDSETHHQNQDVLHPGQGKGEGRGEDPNWDQKREEHWQNRAKEF